MSVQTDPASLVATGPLALKRSDWWRVAKGVMAAAERANLPLIAGGVAFFGLMAAMPGLAAVTALVGLFGNAKWVEDQIGALGGVAPDDAVRIIREQVERLLEAPGQPLLAGALFNLALALWSALQGTRWTLMALTAVNRRAEQRTFLRKFIAAGAYTLYGVGLAVLAVLLMGVAPLLLEAWPLPGDEGELLLLIRWPVLGGAALTFALLLYRWGPRRRPPAWKWIWPGAIAASIFWIAASSALTFALRIYPAFGAAFGSLASVVTLLIWIYLTAYLFLLGGALNAELEFFALGAPSKKVEKDETIEPPISVDGAKKEVAARKVPNTS